MTSPDEDHPRRVRLSISQQNLYNGVLHDGDPELYLIGKSYRFHPVDLSRFLAALEATILATPVQLCVLEAPAAGAGHPELVPRLRAADLVRVTADRGGPGCGELTRSWSSGLLGKPLVRYGVRTDESGRVSGLDVHTHHILLDGGATGIIEAHLARHLGADGAAERPCVGAGLARLAEAHRREADKVAESLRRVAPTVRRELSDATRCGAAGLGGDDSPATASRGVLYESARVCGEAFDAILAVAEDRQVPLNVLVAAAAVAVDASIRQSTEGLLVHTVDNRFGDSDLNVATCLVNSVAHPVRFAPFASVADVVGMLDRDYVGAVRRRWLREEHYRRMWLAINRTTRLAALTLNFIREACAPELRPFLSGTPGATAVGPVEGMTVACVVDEVGRTLDCAIWDRAGLPRAHAPHGVAARITAALTSMAALWDHPIAMAVGEWSGVGPDGSRGRGDGAHPPPQQPAAAWFLDGGGGVRRFLDTRRHVHPWVDWLVRNGVAAGDVVVCGDEDTDTTVDLLIACHLAGCGYSVCHTIDDAPRRARVIAEHTGGAAHVVDVGAAALAPRAESGGLAEARIAAVARDPALAGRTAYIMPTSGTTGRPKLVPVSHGSLAAFCDAARRAYGWGPRDTILQCAPLTSDISVEEIFVAAISGAGLVRSGATRRRDVDALASDLVERRATVIDLPTAVWQLLCQDGAAIEAIRASHLRQIVVGGEPIRPGAVDCWLASAAAQAVSLVSTYGPTETTVVATQLPIADGDTVVTGGDRLRLGRPLLPDTVFVVFGEIVVVGDLVSSGYLGIADPSFGTVLSTDGVRRRAFATADRVVIDTDGFPVFAGRRDALVKISGRRVDTAEVSARVRDDPAVADAAVEVRDGSLGVWFATRRTRGGEQDAAAARIRRILVGLRVPSFFVVGVPAIPRKPGGKIDGDRLRMTTGFVDAAHRDAGSGERAAGLADVWGRHLGRPVGTDTSLLEEGIGSLDLIRILSPTRDYLGRHLGILDLIGADTAANLVADLDADVPASEGWPDAATAAEIERDLARVLRPRPGPAARHGGRSIVVLGASGILGTGFARAVVELKRSGLLHPEVVLATRAAPPESDSWAELRGVEGVRVERLPARFGPADLDALLGRCAAATVVNCAGNTNMLAPYRDIRPANVELVAAAVDACSRHGTRLVHLSTFVVNADVTAPQITDPRHAPYPYAASKALAELAVAGSPRGLDFTVVRLPRVLGEAHHPRGAADVLVSVVDACVASGTYPTLALTEEVTTGRSAARAILGLLPESAGQAELGRGITVVRGERVSYSELLGGFASDELEVSEWKRRLDDSDWARTHPRRWSVVDAWVSLGMRLSGRHYAEYLAEYPTIALDVGSVAEIPARPEPIRALLTQTMRAHSDTPTADALVNSTVRENFSGF